MAARIPAQPAPTTRTSCSASTWRTLAKLRTRPFHRCQTPLKVSDAVSAALLRLELGQRFLRELARSLDVLVRTAAVGLPALALSLRELLLRHHRPPTVLRSVVASPRCRSH